MDGLFQDDMFVISGIGGVGWGGGHLLIIFMWGA